MLLALSLAPHCFGCKPTLPEIADINDRIAEYDCTISASQFLQAISSGRTWAAVYGVCPEQNRRRRLASLWQSQQLFAADVDECASAEQLLAICADYGLTPLCIHHSFSSTHSRPKYHAIFVVTSPVTDVAQAVRIQQMLAKVFAGDK